MYIASPITIAICLEEMVLLIHNISQEKNVKSKTLEFLLLDVFGLAQWYFRKNKKDKKNITDWIVISITFACAWPWPIGLNLFISSQVSTNLVATWSTFCFINIERDVVMNLVCRAAVHSYLILSKLSKNLYEIASKQAKLSSWIYIETSICSFLVHSTLDLLSIKLLLSSSPYHCEVAKSNSSA